MSNATYDKLWKEVQVTLDEVIQVDNNIQGAKPQKDRKKARQIAADLYVRYIVICNKLEECYDQMVQPQKRLLLKKLLDSTLGRVLELKHELVNVDLSEHNYYDDILIKYGITPQEAVVRIPRYFTRERFKEIEERRKFVEKILKNLGALDEIVITKRMTESEAVKLIQAHERARQAHVKFQFIREMRMKEKSLMKQQETKEVNEQILQAAATKIQKVWRGYAMRRWIRKRRMDEMLLIGMIQSSQTISEINKIAEKTTLQRYEKQGKFQDLYETLIVEAKERIRKERSAVMEENMRSEIRNWINTYFHQTGKIPDLPSAESGGSRFIFSRQGTESSMSKSTAPSSKESKKSKKSKSRKGSEPEQSENETTDEFFRPIPSNFLPQLIHVNEEYKEIWKNKDETTNFQQEPYVDMIEEEKAKEVEDEIRLRVDEALRGDIEALQAALDRDKGMKRSKKAQKRVRRSGKKNKRKKEKDLTPDRSTESLFEELLAEGIIKLHRQISLSEFKGENSYANYDLQRDDKESLPTLGDVKKLITEYCILPLGNSIIREFTPLVKSVLIAGPHNSGKTMLVNAICTELGATLFDITPSNIVGKYPGKTGLIMLVHLVSKVSRLLQPSVIYMDKAEKPFMKKIPKTDKTDPKRLKKDLPKLVKNITNEDRVIMIGTSSAPWDADQKSLYQTYDKVIYVPRPDYGSMSLVWRDLLYKFPAISKQFNISAMTKICDGFTIGAILAAINEVMTTKRMMQLKTLPLTHAELVNAISMKDPVYREEEDAFLAWFSKTPTCRKKQKAYELELQKLEEANEAKKKRTKTKTN